jgi:cytochrome c oxidase subunit II
MNRLPAGRRRPPVALIVAAVLIFILAVVVVVAAVTVFQLPDPITEQGGRTETLYIPVLIISFIVYFGVTAGIIWAIFRYRRVDDSIPEQIHGSSVLEATWTIIPIIILVALFIPALILVIDLKSPPAEADADLTVEAVGHQWWWEFIYPDDGVRVQQTPPDYNTVGNQPPALVVPVNQTIVIKVRSTDVVHSFSGPSLLYKIQAIPGNVNVMHVKFEKTGTFPGQCYQFCGLRHADMLFVFDVREESDYQSWLRDAQAAQGVPAQQELTAVEDR